MVWETAQTTVRETASTTAWETTTQDTSRSQPFNGMHSDSSAIQRNTTKFPGKNPPELSLPGTQPKPQERIHENLPSQ